jgi:hypothetical protein
VVLVQRPDLSHMENRPLNEFLVRNYQDSQHEPYACESWKGGNRLVIALCYCLT